MFGKEFKEALSRIKALAKQMKTGCESVWKEMFANKSLTERKLEVARLAAEGLSNQQIADTLHISINTIKDHLKTINTKCETRDRAARYKKLIQN
jgi:DNA-binding NarL/FixJ family response regulator